MGWLYGFSAPASFTGEDVAELHVHGGRATIDALASSPRIVAGYANSGAWRIYKAGVPLGKD